MKIQCSCGAKYSFDITQEMLERGVQLVCQSCGTDCSEAITAMIRSQFGAPASVALSSSPPVESSSSTAVAEAPPAPPPPAAATTTRARLHVSRASTASAPEAEAPAAQVCFRHMRQPITHSCLVCQKPMCAQCLQLFGYVCSPHCRTRAESLGINVPVYGGQRFVAEGREWKKIGRIAAALSAVVALLLGSWFWYAWFGSRPKAVFSVRFEDPWFSGSSRICGNDQIVFLHGVTFARYDLKKKEAVWTRELVSKSAFKEMVDTTVKELDERMQKQFKDTGKFTPVPSESDVVESFKHQLGGQYTLHVSDSNVWLETENKMVLHDFNTGNPIKEIEWTQDGSIEVRGNTLVRTTQTGGGGMMITHFDLNTGSTREERVGKPPPTLIASASQSQGSGSRTGAQRIAGTPRTAGAALPRGGAPGSDRTAPLDPATVEAQAQRMPLPARIALPATLSSTIHQERILNELDDENPRAPVAQADGQGSKQFSTFVRTPNGYLEFTVRLLQEIKVARTAMKAAPTKSVLSNPTLNVTQTAEVANEILNDLQRLRGGDVVVDDFSRYSVTLHLPDGSAPDWTGEVIGPPEVFPLTTVTVLTAGTNLIVFDKANKKLWQATLTHAVQASFFGNNDDPEFGQGPCVERGDTLYAFDEAVLTAFDLKSGAAKWRVPSVGVKALFFDPEGLLYVNTTSAGLESIKYSRQIDINRQTKDVVLKVDPATGKVLWASGGSAISRLSGKFIYMIQYAQGDDHDLGMGGLPPTPSYMRIERLNPDDGTVMWEHFEQRAPLSVNFRENVIELVFRKEVEVLKFLSF